uniref:methionine adenosyltransferase n=1 Tax=Mesorhizobium atlanticum TaxID=2233532 RepID=UPI0037041910
MVSRIGAPVTSPALVQVKLATRDGLPAIRMKARVEDIVTHQLSRIPQLIDEFIAGALSTSFDFGEQGRRRSALAGRTRDPNFQSAKFDVPIIAVIQCCF